MEIDPLQARVNAASDALKSFVKGAIGLTPDAVKASPEYQAAKREYVTAFAALRLRNSVRAK